MINMLLGYLVGYLGACLVWAWYAFRMQRECYKPPMNCWRNCFYAAFINFILCPYAIYIALKNKKF